MIAFLRKYVLHNLGLKLLSLIASVLLWLAVVRDPSAETVITIPVQFQSPPADLIFSSEHLPQAEIRVRGPERMVRELDQENVHATLDLSRATPGEHTYDLNPHAIRVPRGVDVVQVIPAQFRITFDTESTKVIPVRPRVIGSLASGVELASAGVMADPAQVVVRGPAQRVNQIEAVLTDPVDATGVVGRATFTTNVYVPDPLVRVAHPEPIHVTVVTQQAGAPGKPARRKATVR